MKSIKKNLEFIKKYKVRITLESRHLPGGTDHNLICWLCNRRSAVYAMYPQWVFMPCWKCQKQYEGIWTEKKNWLGKLWKKFYK